MVNAGKKPANGYAGIGVAKDAIDGIRAIDPNLKPSEEVKEIEDKVFRDVGGGVTGGAAIGGTIGTFIAPGVGTAIGAAIGGAVGGAGGAVYYAAVDDNAGNKDKAKDKDKK